MLLYCFSINPTNVDQSLKATSLLEASIQKMPLVSLEEAAKPLEHLISDLYRIVSEAKSQSENPKGGLTIDESASIRLFCMEWNHGESLYLILQKTLRSEDLNALKPWLLYLRLILSALRKLPRYQGILYRGTRSDVNDQYLTGSTHTWKSFSSTTISMNVAGAFSNATMGTSGPRTLFHIESVNGRNIREHSLFYEEDEVLLLPDFHFKVLETMDAGNGLRIISIKEIEA